MSIYRKIYEQNFGFIPKEPNGRSYEIHHIDGNHSNNHLQNLKAVTIQEHYDIHWKQCDWGACYAIGLRMKLDINIISELSKKTQNKQVKEGTHHLLGGEIQRRYQNLCVQNGTHNFTSELQLQRFANKTHNLLGVSKQRVENGTHHFLDKIKSKERSQKRLKDGTHPWLHHKKITCPHCNKIGSNGAMIRWHFENCKMNLMKHCNKG